MSKYEQQPRREKPLLLAEAAKAVGAEELQAFLKSSEVDLPESRRDISKDENLRWIIRNILIRNTVPPEIWTALKRELQKRSR